MSTTFGQFAGKVAFGSFPADGQAVYLTAWTVRKGLQVPAMKAPAITDQEQCILYAQADGSLRIQLGNLLWIGLQPQLDWLVLTDDPAQAAALVLQGNPPGQSWQAHTPSGLLSLIHI